MKERDLAASLASGEAYADLSAWRKIEVSGADGGPWLQDLVSADLADVVAGRARPSLLLSPTGRVRAAFTVVRRTGDWMLLQDPSQPRPIDGLLAPYMLSSDVRLEDRSGDLRLFALPGGMQAPADGWSAPSCLGAGGLDVIAPTSEGERLEARLRGSLVAAPAEAVDTWRIRAGIPRFGVDALEDDLPQEAGLDDAVAFDKGCYLGQESVAKVRNLGHPRRLVLPFAASRPVVPGEAILLEGAEVGVVTSAAPSDGSGYQLLARIRWDARDAPLRTASGPLDRSAPVHPSSPV